MLRTPPAGDVTIRDVSATPSATPTLTVLVYSHSSLVREQVRLALGRRPAPELPPIEIVECATAPAVMSRVDDGGIDVLVLDGEAQPAGGMSVCVSIKEEVFQAPPVVLITGRPQDAWLASWSRADAVVPRPLDALELAEAVAGLLRRRVAGSAPARQA
jgi:DNA-binding response OmpR family regulator